MADNKTGNQEADNVMETSVVTEKEKTEDSQKEKVKAEQKKEQKSMEEKTLHGGATEVKEEDVCAMMYLKLTELFGGGNQLFTMEFPGRVLNKEDYLYDIKDYNGSSLNKPYSVAENEFRLSDNMIDPYPIVQGSNDKSLSTIYTTAINNLTPKITDVKDYITDKMELRMFLMQPVTDMFDGEMITCSRLEFCQKTYLRYLNKKYEWNQEKIDRRTQFEKDNDLDGYARWLSTTAWTKDNELETLFNDAVIRGFYHEVMTILGFIDSQSPSERLSKAKNARNTSSRKSLDESMEILPVNMQPSNWAQALKTNFSYTDLSLDPAYLKTEYLAKKKLLSDYEAELRILEMNNTKNQSVAALEADIAKAQKALVEDEQKSFADYTKAQIEMVKLAFEVVSNGDIVTFIAGAAGGDALKTVFETLEKSADFVSIFSGKDVKEGDSDWEALTGSVTKLINLTYEVYNDNLEYFEKFNELVNLKAALAQMQSQKYEDRIIVLSEKIAILRSELESIAAIITASANNPQTLQPSDLSTDNLLPVSKDDEGVNFTDIVFSSETMQQDMEKMSGSTYGKLGGSIGNLFFNTRTEGEYSSSQSAMANKIYNSKFVVGMRVMKVTIDRGGWFDPAIFDISSSFMRIRNKITASTGVTADRLLHEYMNHGAKSDTGNKEVVNTPQEAVRDILTDDNGNVAILPMYPVSFLIVKDFVLKANIKDFSETEFEQFRKYSASTTTSLFGIRVSGGFTHESYAGHSEAKDNMTTLYIRTPGPQVIGWFSEMTGKDESTPYASLSTSEEFNQIIDELKIYKEKLEEIKTSVPVIKTISDGVYGVE